MTISLSIPIGNLNPEPKPQLTVIGVGCAGGSALNHLIRSRLEGVAFIAVNTDTCALTQSVCERRIQLGSELTRGFGAGGVPDIGRIAAKEAVGKIIKELSGSQMVLITAGMGGGTGTGAAPVIAQALRAQGILVIGVVTTPFHFEGEERVRNAKKGIARLKQATDALVVFANQNLLRVAGCRTTFAGAYKMAGDVLSSGVRAATDLMMTP